MTTAIWQGILTGMVLSTFVGPIFFAVVDLGLKGDIKGAAFLAFGTFISDMLTVALIYMVAGNINHSSPVLGYMYWAGGILLIVLGLQTILKAKTNEQSVVSYQSNLWKLFIKGFLINGTNPNVIFFWFGAVMVAVHTYQNDAKLVLTHFLSALSIVFSTDFLKGYGASLLRPYIRHDKLVYLARLSGIVLIYFGLKLILFH